VLVMKRPGGDGPITAIDPGPEQTEIKGDPGLLVFRKRESRLERLSQGAHAAQGDQLQLDYVHSAGYGVVLSLDGAGRITLHLPQAGTDAAVRLTNGQVRLPSSYELDDAPRFERFFIVTADAPFSAATVVDAARSLSHSSAAATGKLPLPPETFRQASIRIAKAPKEQP